jgi:hypothetical protein
MKLAVCLTLAVFFSCLGAGALYGQCTEEEMLAKARMVQQRFEKLERDNYSEYARLLLRFNNKASLLHEEDTGAWCDLYEQMLLEM